MSRFVNFDKNGKGSIESEDEKTEQSIHDQEKAVYDLINYTREW